LNPAPPVISLQNVSFSYRRAPVLEDVTFSIGAREAVCMVGPNGGGKTTLVKLILGLLAPERGEIRVFGEPPRRARLRAGYMPQHAQHDPLFPACVMDIILMGRLGCRNVDRADPLSQRERGGFWSRWFRQWTGWPNRSDQEAARNALDLVDMKDFEKRPFASLSGGQRQRVLIARAIASDPELLLLDEPTSNVDSLAESRLLELLRKLNRRMTIVTVTHDLGFVSGLVENVVCVNRRVTVHPTHRLTGEMIHELYGGEVRMVKHTSH
jgi:zinc transport system ATP-binding protein